MTDEQIEDLRRQEFIRGYCAACAEWTSGCVPAVTLAYKAYEKRNHDLQTLETTKAV